jgi:putative tryptophan/tyrosine transport system substrate-binding protein
MQLDQLKRREFITLVGGAGAVGWQFAASAQPPAMPVIGFLSIATPETWAEYVSAFKHGLGQAGFVEGQNVAIKYRWAGSDYSRLPALAKELVERQVSVIASNGGARAALAAKAATSSIPIVFLFGDGDPVKYRLVESISRPGGNVTGVTMIAGVLEPKRLELLREIAPKPTAIHILVNPNNAGVLQDIPTVAAAAGKLGLAFEVVQAGTESEIDAAFTTLAREHAQALMVANDGFFTIRRAQIVALAARHAVPADLSMARIRGRRRSDQLRDEHSGGLSARGCVCRSNSQRPHAHRVAGTAADQVRAGHQRQDGKGTRARNPDVLADTCRRGD